MATLDTVVIAKDSAVVTINARDLDAFESDGWDLGVETVTATAQSPTVTLGWLTFGQLKAIAAESGIQDPSQFDKAALILEILRVKGLVSYAAPE